MRLFKVLGTTVIAALLIANSASAFSSDDHTLNDTNGNPRFSDPDDQMPAGIFTTGNSTSNFGQDNNNAQNPASSGSTAAPFSPSNGFYLPKH